MHAIDTYRQYSRAIARAAGKPVVIFDAQEAANLFKSYPFLIPYVGREPKGWRLVSWHTANRDNVSGVNSLIADIVNRTDTYAFGVIDATPNSMHIGVFTKVPGAAEALTDEEFLGGEDPRTPTVG